MQTANQLKTSGMREVSDHNVYWKSRALSEIKWMRSGRILNPRCRDEVFTFESLLPTLEMLIGRKLPNCNLAGPIVADALRLGYFQKTGRYVQATSAQKHERECREYRWKPDAV